jgi:hypothetical protein
VATEIWDEKARNSIGVFPTLEQALAFVRETIELGGEKDIHDWMMDSPESGGVLRGQEIIDRAHGVAALPRSESSSARAAAGIQPQPLFACVVR